MNRGRKAQNKQFLRRGKVEVTGMGLGTVRESAPESIPSWAPASLSPAPPSPDPPSAVPAPKPPTSARRPSQWVSGDPNSEYMRSMREHTKAQLQSITGRMFQVRPKKIQTQNKNNYVYIPAQVLNDYEDSTATESTYMKV